MICIDLSQILFLTIWWNTKFDVDTEEYKICCLKVYRYNVTLKTLAAEWHFIINQIFWYKHEKNNSNVEKPWNILSLD